MPVPTQKDDALPGRAAELQQLRELLDGEARLVTVLGPPGIGKSKLCERMLAVPVPRAHRYYDVHDVTRREELILAVTSVNGEPLAAAHVRAAWTELAQKWTSGLRKKARCLVFFDGVDGVLPQVRAALAALLAKTKQTDKLRFLVTSRQPLGLPEEQLLPLKPLSLSDARQLCPPTASTPQARALDRLLGELGGIPLFIELLAARLDRHGPEAMRKRLVANEHEVLTTVFELLDGREQSVLRACAVFTGGIPSDALSEVAGEDATDAVIERLLALRLLRAETQSPTLFGERRYFLSAAMREIAAARLVQSAEKDTLAARHADYFYRASDRLKERERLSEFLQDATNFLSAFRWFAQKPAGTDNKKHREQRYWFSLHLLDVLRGYSLFEEDYGSRHVRCFLPASARLFIAGVARRDSGPDLRRQHWALEAYAQALAQAGRTELARKNAALARSLNQQYEKLQDLVRSADSAMRRDAPKEAERCLRKALARCTRGTPDLLGIRHRLAKCLHASGKLAEADRLFRGLLRGKALSSRYYLDRALLLRDLKRPRRALALSRSAAAAAEKSNIRSLRSEADGWSARLLHEQGLATDAEHAYREALGRCLYDGAQLRALFRFQESDVAGSHACFVEMSGVANGGYGNPSQAGGVLARLGALRIEQGRFTEAEELLVQALRIQRESRQSEAAAWSEVTLSCALIAGERRLEAEPLLLRAIERFGGNDLRARIARATALGNLGNLYMDLGRLTEARKQYETALAALDGTQQRSSEGIILISLGLLLQELGEAETGRLHLLRAGTLFREIYDGRGEPRWQGVAAIAMGQFLHTQGDLKEAAAHYEQGLAFVLKKGDRSSQARALSYLGALEGSRGLAAEAAQRFAGARQILEGTGDRQVAELLAICAGFQHLAEVRAAPPHSATATEGRATLARLLSAPEPRTLEARIFLRMLKRESAAAQIL